MSSSRGEINGASRIVGERSAPPSSSQAHADFLLRPVPTLPYDASYLPLSPNGVDQIGHPLPLPPSTSSDPARMALELSSRSGRAGGATAAGKKSLPGQELEVHLVSEAAAQRAMPWGLKATLLQHKAGGRPGRTKAGSARRTVHRDARRTRGMAGTGAGDGAGGRELGAMEIELPKVEDDIMSETELASIPVTEAVALDVSEGISSSRLSTPMKGKQEAANGIVRRMTAAPHPANGSPNKLMHASGEEVSQIDRDEGAGNNEFCETCGGVGRFICCDGCPRSFHFACINPPLDINELPSAIGDASDTWFCNVCRAAAAHKPAAGRVKAAKGLFGPLMRKLEEENPTIFALPPDIRNYFKGVATASDGSYVDSSMLRPIRVNKFGILDEREPLRLKDRNGKPILCYRCGESALPPAQEIATTTQSEPGRASTSSLITPQRAQGQAASRPSRKAAQIAIAALTPKQQSKAAEEEDTAAAVARRAWRKIIPCDFCSLHWHLDCLDPPLASMPSLGRKWMCPNHIEHAMPSERIPKSVANSTSVHDLPLPSKETIGPGKHYRMRVVNDGLIDIIPDPMDTYTGPSHDSSEALFGTLIASDSNASAGKISNGKRRRTDEDGTALHVPAYKGYPSVFGRHSNVKSRYRLPEKVIQLDFWSKAELVREQLAAVARRQAQDRQHHGLDLLAVIADAASYDEGGGGDAAAAASSSSSLASEPQMKVAHAKELVERILPDDDGQGQEHDHPYIRPGEEPVSTMRRSFLPGEYEREFEGGGRNGVDDAEDGVVKQEATTNGRDSVSSGLSDAPPTAPPTIDEAEVGKLQAIKQLLAYKGQGALLRFLLE